MTSTGERADAWTGQHRTRGGTVFDVRVNPDAVTLPALATLHGGPWSACIVKVRGVTAKGNATHRDFAVLERIVMRGVKQSRVRVRAEPAGHLPELKRLADRLNGWELGREFPPGRPERWRMQNKLPPAKPED